jgi:hypothetical protein
VIERFDFFDIYGYLLPGSALLLVLWLPYGRVTHRWPSAEWSETLLLLVVAYLAGLLLHGLAAYAFPEAQLHKGGRYPSGFLLDDDNPFFGRRKPALIRELSRLYGEDVSTGLDCNEVDFRRREAFLMCRAVLRARSLAGYAEHMQGLYVLMRGLTAACVAGAAFVFGWAISTFTLASVAAVVTFLVVAILYVILVGATFPRWSYWWAVAGALLTGIVLGVRLGVTAQKALEFFVIASGLLVVARRAYAAYKYFTEEFAKTVYRDFFTLRQAPFPTP